MMRTALLFISLFAAAGCGPSVSVDSASSQTPPIEHTPAEAPADACMAGEPFTIATIRSPEGLAFGEGNLFFVDGGGLYDCTGAVYAVPLGGGEPVPLATELCAPNRIVYADGSLYWVSHSGYVAPNGYVTRLSLSDGSMEDLVVGLISPDAIAIDDQYIYVGSEGETGLKSPGHLMRIDRATNAVVLLGVSPGRVADITVDEQYVYWSGSVGFLNGKENHDSGVFRVPKEGGDAVELAKGLAWPSDLSRIGTRVVFAHSFDGEIVSMAADGADPVTIAEGFAYPEGVAVDAAGEVFFTAFGEPAGLFAVPLDGSAAPRVVAEPLGAGREVALGATCVYWTELYVDDDFNGVVRKTAR